jgi:hypothetical protein
MALQCSRMFSVCSYVESVVDDVFEIFAHANLTHHFVFVTVDARQLADMRKDVLQSVGELEGVHVS